MALALAGGGPLGAVYEIGAITALSEALDGLDFNDMDVYVGVSAGAFITAGLANGLTPGQLCRMFIDGESALVPFNPNRFLVPAYGEFWRRSSAVPGLLWDGFKDWMLGNRQGLLDAFTRLSRALPTGLFDNDAVARYLAELFAAHGRGDDFRELNGRLFLVATNLDTGEAVAFGGDDTLDVPISKAIQASAALPGLFPPVRINGQWFVDGALKKTLHASVALKEGAELVLCINPLVPFNARRAAEQGKPNRAGLVEGGLTTVLSQTFRAIIHSRMEVGIAKYDLEYPNADVILFEPDHGDTDLFFTNMFSYATRRQLCEHAYAQTRQALRDRLPMLGPQLARHGVTIRTDVLDDPTRTLSRQLARLNRRRSGTLGQAVLKLDDTLDRLESELRREAAAR